MTIEYTSAETLRSESSKDITNPATGHAFRIRKISMGDLWAEGILTSDPLGDDEESSRIKASYPEATEILRFKVAALERSALLRGVASVRVVPGVAQGEGSIGIDEMDPSDRIFLRNSILEFSGVALVAEEGADSPGATFQPATIEGGESPDDGTGDSPTRDNLRETAVGDTRTHA